MEIVLDIGRKGCKKNLVEKVAMRIRWKCSWIVSKEGC